MATEEITISELELADEILGDMNIPVDTATETRAVTLKQLRAWLGSALPVGSIFASVGRIDDERYTLLDGKTISRTGTYEAFCNKVVEKVQAGTWKACTEEEFNLEVSETGQCGKFVVSNDYVRIPKLGNSLCSGVIDGKIPVVGNGMTLGLTNGTQNGSLAVTQNSGYSLSANTSTYGTSVSSSNGSDTNRLTGRFGVTTDPTKSGIEGKINSVEVFYYMVISTEGQTAKVEIDINKVYEDLNVKANSDLSNVSSVASSFKEQSVGWGMPDYDSGITISASGYTAPSNGWILSNIYSDWGTSSANGRLLINNIIVSANYHSAGGAGKGHNNVFIVPISKGDVVTYTGNVSGVIFYPCKGVN